MINLDFGDLQAEFKKILSKPRTKTFKPTEPDVHYLTPKRACRVWDILVTDDFDPYFSIAEYWEVKNLNHFMGKQAVFHSHPVGKVCFASDFCHQYGYLPTGVEDPRFIQAFYRKWKHLYENPYVPSSSDQLLNFNIEF